LTGPAATANIHAMSKILIIDDDKTFLRLTSRYLKKSNMECLMAEDWPPAKSILNENDVDAVLVDLFLPSVSGIDIIREIKSITPDIPILMITAHSSIQTAIDAVKAGAEDYIQKPCENSEILFKVQRVMDAVRQTREKEEELRELRETISGQYRFENLLTRDEDMRKVFQMAETAAGMDVTILVQGETGTGKEMLARAIHAGSPRRNSQMVVVNCAALNENLIESELFGHQKGAFTSAYTDKVGRCELVGDGTLFIDEVGELSLSVQKKLLRLLQEKEFEPIGSTTAISFKGRIIVATHRDLRKMVKDGAFREDLFFRINVFPLFLKPLRSRPVDIMDLAGIFLERYTSRFQKNFTGFSPEATRIMLKYVWKGNVRELEHFIERQVLINPGPIVEFDQIESYDDEVSVGIFDEPDAKPSEVNNPFGMYMKAREKEYLVGLMTELKGSIEKVADRAQIHRKTLYLKLKEFGLDKKQFRS